MSELRVIILKCPACGARLEVGADMQDGFACGYCGTSLAVERKGGTLALKPVTDALARVQVGTDRTAAELALRRYADERDKLNAQRTACVQEHETFTEAESAEYEDRDGRRTPPGTILAWGVVAFFVAQFASKELLISLAAASVFIVWFVAQAYVRRADSRKVAESIRESAEEMQADLNYIDAQIAVLDAKIAAKRLAVEA